MMPLLRVVALLSLMGLAGSASAANPYPCWIYPNQQWFQSRTFVDVWVTTGYCLDSNTEQIVDFSPMRATQLTQQDLVSGLQRALAVWNEESGSSIKLRYRGTTTNCYIANAVMVSGQSEDQGGQPLCPGNQADAHPDIVNGLYTGGRILLYKYKPGQSGCQPTPLSWTTAPILGASSTLGFVRTLVHEFGHQVFNIGDINQPPTATNCAMNNQRSTMSYQHEHTQTLSNWDLDIAQSRYGSRSNGSAIYKTRMSGPTSWFGALRANGDSFPNYKRPLFRMGSMTIRTNVRVLGWVYGYTTIQDGGTGHLGTTRYNLAAMPNWNLYFGANETLGRPVAVTSRWQFFGTPEDILVAYRKKADLLCGDPLQPCDIWRTDQGKLCYMRSSNGGMSFGAETCFNDSEYLTRAYGLSATYDLISGRYILTWSDSNWVVRVLTIRPSDGQAVLTTMNVSSPHAPSVACAGGFAAECLLAYQTADSASTLAWLKFSIDGSGFAVVSSSEASAWALVDGPSVVYDADAGVYRLAYAYANAAIYSYRMTAFTGTTWTGTGDIWNNTWTHVSTPALSTRPYSSAVTRPYAWFIRYW